MLALSTFKCITTCGKALQCICFFFFGARNSGQPSLSADGFKLLFIRRVFFGGAWGEVLNFLFKATNASLKCVAKSCGARLF